MRFSAEPYNNEIKTGLRDRMCVCARSGQKGSVFEGSLLTVRLLTA